MDEDTSSGYPNYYRMVQLIDKLNPLLLKILFHRYTLLTSTEWEDSPKSGSKLLSFFKDKKNLKKPGFRLQPLQSEMLDSGDSSKFDTSLIVSLLLDLDYSNIDLIPPSIQQDIESQNSTIEKVRPFRNKDAHLPTRRITTSQFKEMWFTLSPLLLDLGGRAEEIDDIFQMSVEEISDQPILFNILDAIESFRGREKFLQNLHQQIQTQGGRITVLSQLRVISGLGGIGKTQAVRKYIELYKSSYRNIIWINAETSTAIHNSFQLLAQSPSINVRTNEERGGQRSIHAVVKEIYDKLRRHVTLLIFDNAEKLGKEVTPSDPGDEEGAIRSYLPGSTGANQKIPFILVTTRNGGDWGVVLKNVIPISVFDDDEIVDFILDQLSLEKSEENLKDALTLGHLLGGLPLALQQAVAYILNENEFSFCSLFTIKDYIEKYEEFHIESEGMDSILNFPPLDSTETVYTTWKVTLDKIGSTREGEVTLKVLDILTILDPDNIPCKFLLDLCDPEERKSIERGLGILKKYSMINVVKKDGQNLITIHRQVQHVILEKVKEDNKMEELFKNLLVPCSSVINKYLAGDPIYRSVLTNVLRFVQGWDKWLPHWNGKIGHLKLKRELAVKFQAIGWHIMAHSILCEVESIEISRLQTASPESSRDAELELLSTQHFLGTVLDDQSKFSQAMTLFTPVYERRSILLGVDHPDTLTTQNSMARVLKNQQKYDESFSLYEKVLKSRQKILNPNHPDTLFTANAIAVVLELQKKHREAYSMYKELYERRVKVLEGGAEHPDSLTTRNNMARTLDNQLMHEESLRIYEEVLELRRKILGQEHPETLKTWNNMARVLGNLKRKEEAEEIFRKVLEIRQEILGPSHYDTLTSQGNLARLLGDLGRYEEAYGLYERVWVIRKEILPPDHLDLLGTRHNMARSLDSLGKLEESLRMYTELLGVREKYLGKEHSDCLRTKFNMGRVLGRLGRVEESLEMYEEVLEVKERKLEENDKDLVFTRKVVESLREKVGRKVNMEEE